VKWPSFETVIKERALAVSVDEALAQPEQSIEEIFSTP
jgi:hypothetical protein